MIIPDIKPDLDGNLSSIPVLNYLSSGKPLQFDCNIKTVALNEDQSLILDDSGNVYAFGNNDKGQLGLGHSDEVEAPRVIQELKGRVKDIKSTGDINLAITTNNELFIWPFEDNKQYHRPLRLYLDKKIIISTVSCGKNFAVIVSKNGLVYSFGSKNKYGELGLGDFYPRLTPEPNTYLAEGGEKIIQVSCGFKHTLALSSNGKVFSWGLVNED